MDKRITVDQATLNEESKKSNVKSPFRLIYKDVKIPWGQLIFALLVGMVNYLLLSLTTSTMSSIIAGQIEDFSIVITWAALHLSAFLLTIFEVAGSLATLKIVYGVQTKLWDHIVHLPMRYYDKESPARLISRVTSDAAYAATPFTLVIAAGGVLVVIVVGVASMTAVSGKMVIALLVGFALTLVYSLFIMTFARKAGAMTTNRLSKFTAFLSERLSSIRLIKASVSEDREYKEGEKLIELRYQAGVYTAFTTALNEISGNLTGISLILASFVIGSMLVERGEITDGSGIYLFYSFGAIIVVALATFFQYPATFAAMLGQVNNFTAVLNTPVEDTVTGSAIPEENEDITLNNVEFRYAEDKPVLNGVNCVIPKGKKTAIIGANGTGKSTLMKMIDRLYTIDGGEIKYGDTDVSAISLKSWRERFGMVAQNASLFSGTIRENICYGIDRDVTDDELWAVAKAADLEDLIQAQPEGFDFNIGEAGAHLSGGEQQRVSIARAMMKNPDYLILDEATANLDAKSADEIQTSLKTLMEGRTTIMIAHSPTIVRSADNIIVMENGTVTACGTHEELLKASDFYNAFIEANSIMA